MIPSLGHSCGHGQCISMSEDVVSMMNDEKYRSVSLIVYKSKCFYKKNKKVQFTKTQGRFSNVNLSSKNTCLFNKKS